MWEVIGLITGVVGKVIDRLVPDADKAMELKNQIQNALIQQQSEIVKASASVMMADAAQDDKFVKRARPMVVYWAMAFTTGIAFLAPFGYSKDVILALQQVPSDLWNMMMVGIGAFGFSRSIEKGVSAIAGKK